MKCSIWAFTLFLSVNAASARANVTLNVQQMGTIGDGTTPATQIVQKAIDQCSASGGGTVNFPAGRYLVGTIQIKDNVTLHLDENAVLLGSLEKADYQNVDPFMDGDGHALGYALIVAKDAKNIAFEGAGALDGQGKSLSAAEKKSGGYTLRPFLLRLIRCENVSVTGIHLQASGAWALHLFQCENVAIDHVTIHNRGLSNNDGIDIDSSQDVKITHCDIISGDDSICLKTTSSKPCTNITVQDCDLTSGEGTIKTGTESMGDFTNIAIDHCRIHSSGEAGIQLFSVDGGHMDNVAISDIQMDHNPIPIMIRLGARLKTFRKGDIQESPGTIRNIHISNITATHAGRIGILISGVPDHPIEDVHLSNIHIELAGGGTAADAAVKLDEKPAAYPHIVIFGKTMPAYTLYARHIKTLEINGLALLLANPDARPPSICIDVAQPQFKNWNVPTSGAHAVQ